ncbi:hypothetical protein TcCL_ESM11290 [Trypanosoma cruzi]|nr:hypothetical protein TcCL_ESM11290 [Trypanosoma cruzi]
MPMRCKAGNSAGRRPNSHREFASASESAAKAKRTVCPKRRARIHSLPSHRRRFHDGRVSGRREDTTHPATTPRCDHHRWNFAVQHAVFSVKAMTDWPAAARHAPQAATGNCGSRPA